MYIQFQVVSFVRRIQGAEHKYSCFPIDVKGNKNKEELENEDKSSGFDPNAINLKLSELVKLFHGSFDSKSKLIDDFNEINPECSKNSIERKIKEFFTKDKKGDDPKLRFYANEEILMTLSDVFPGGFQNEELVAL